MATLYDYDDDNNNNSVLIYMQIQQPKGQKFSDGQDSVHGIFLSQTFFNVCAKLCSGQG
jgi:hypothetical protein